MFFFWEVLCCFLLLFVLFLDFFGFLKMILYINHLVKNSYMKCSL